MAFPQPNAQRELANRKILEELQLKKQMLLKQGAASALNSSAPPSAAASAAAAAAAAAALPMCSIPPVSSIIVLESRLQGLEGFPQPDVRLEQYETPPHIAAAALHTIQSEYDDLESRLVLDAGCGPGALAAGAALLGAAAVTCVDVDPAALRALRDNMRSLSVDTADAVLADLCGPAVHRWDKHFDTVLMNPPFGTKHNAGADIKFLQVALAASCGSVYSFHKSSTRNYIKKKVREWCVEGSVVAELRYDLPATYRFHKQRSRDIAVDLWRLHHVT